jgi:rhamnose transport system permease protein
MSRREVSVAIAIGVLAIVLALVAPGYFAVDNLRDVFAANVPVLIAAIGMTMVILTGQIDISIGSMFAVCGVAAGLLAKEGTPAVFACIAAMLAGACLGAINGALVAYARIPAIVVTLATMVAWRDGLRWITQGTWVSDLPADFQWLDSRSSFIRCCWQASSRFSASSRSPRSVTSGLAASSTPWARTAKRRDSRESTPRSSSSACSS